MYLGTNAGVMNNIPNFISKKECISTGETTVETLNEKRYHFKRYYFRFVCVPDPKKTFD